MNHKFRLLEDLLKDARLRAWVMEGKHAEYWTAWKSEHPEDLDVLEDARAMVSGLPVKIREIKTHEIDQSFDELSRKLKDPATKRRILIPTFVRYAAAVILILVGTMIWNTMESNREQPLTLTAQTLPGVLETIDLPDSSTVVLNGNSTLEYFSDEEERRVKLKGEAHFQVNKILENSIPEKFIVSTPALHVEVLGTTFSVSTDSIWTTIVLEEGSVSLKSIPSHNKEISNYLMEPGEKVIYNSLDGTFISHPVDAASYNSWTSNKLSLVNRSVEELVRWFDGIHDITIQVPPEYEDRELSGTVDLENKETAVRMIAMALGLSPEQINKNTWNFK